MHTGGTLAIDGTSFTVAGKDNATLRGTFLAPAGVQLSAEGGRLTATGGREFFVVMAVRKGEAPKVEASGAGLGARAKIGKRQVAFDGRSICIEN
jgi:hypothetical protein